MSDTQNNEPREPLVDARDVMMVIGIAMIGTGLWFVYPPLSAIVPGAILTAVSVLGVK